MHPRFFFCPGVATTLCQLVLGTSQKRAARLVCLSNYLTNSIGFLKVVRIV